MRPRKVASASAFSWTTIFILVIAIQVQGEQYSISQISPNSASNHDHVEPSRVFQTSEQQIDLKPSTSVNQEDEHDIVKRSANPILHENGRTSRIVDDLSSSSRHFDETLDSNDVEVQRKSRYYNQIQPTKTSKSGEVRGVLRSRSLSPEGPRHPKQLDALETTNTATGSLRYDVPTGRQSNPDIQDIITGIVKLLNGNVNVQANTQPGSGRPNRPPNTRINNRGPPRISDVPPLPPDFDTPGPAGPGQLVPPLPPQPSTKMPPPYPFDRPPSHDQTPPPRPFLNGVPLPEQIVPVNQNYRPNFVNGRPPQNIPPWQRPRPRPPQNPNRRPNPNLPMYKPLSTSGTT